MKKTGMKETLMKKTKYISIFLDLGLKSNILWNIKIKQEIFFPRIGKVSPDIWEILSFLSLGIESSIPWNIRKTFFWKNVRNFSKCVSGKIWEIF